MGFGWVAFIGSKERWVGFFMFFIHGELYWISWWKSTVAIVIWWNEQWQCGLMASYSERDLTSCVGSCDIFYGWNGGLSGIWLGFWKLEMC